MIAGLGTDIVEIDRIASVFARHGQRFAEKILAEHELSSFLAAREPVLFLAKRFAVKEAAAKALGTGFRGGVSYRDIGITHDELGAPALLWSGQARRVLEQKSIASSWVTLSDERHYVVATVILEC